MSVYIECIYILCDWLAIFLTFKLSESKKKALRRSLLCQQVQSSLVPRCQRNADLANTLSPAPAPPSSMTKASQTSYPYPSRHVDSAQYRYQVVLACKNLHPVHIPCHMPLILASLRISYQVPHYL